MCIKYYTNVLKSFMLDLPSPVNLNYMFGLGVSLGLIYTMQMLSGVILSWYYSVQLDGAFWSVIGLMQDVHSGWVVRFIHSSGVSVFFVFLYLHIYRGVMYGSFRKISVWVSGVVLLVLIMGVSFLGYVLPWGSMSFWGMTVVTSMFSALPLVGEDLTHWIWGGSSAGVYTLVRFFSYHYILGLLVMVGVVFHMMELHVEGSSNPLGIDSHLDKIMFHSVFSWKDILGLLYVLGFYWVVVFIMPYMLMDASNFEEVDYSKTPVHIKPEWYFLFVYCILRSTPNKLGGVMLMGLAIIILFLFCLTGTKVFRSVGFLYWKVMSVGWGFIFIVLTWLGGSPVEYPFDMLGLIFTICYFLIVLCMTLVGVIL